VVYPYIGDPVHSIHSARDCFKQSEDAQHKHDFWNGHDYKENQGKDLGVNEISTNIIKDRKE